MFIKLKTIAHVVLTLEKFGRTILYFLLIVLEKTN